MVSRDFCRSLAKPFVIPSAFQLNLGRGVILVVHMYIHNVKNESHFHQQNANKSYLILLVFCRSLTKTLQTLMYVILFKLCLDSELLFMILVIKGFNIFVF